MIPRGTPMTKCGRDRHHFTAAVRRRGAMGGKNTSHNSSLNRAARHPRRLVHSSEARGLATDGTALLKRVVIGTLAIVIVVNTHQVFGIGTKCPAEFYEFFLGPISITLDR